MKRLILIALAAALVPAAWAKTVVVCDPDHPAVAGKALTVYWGVQTADFDSRQDVILDADLSGVQGTNPDHWRCTAQGAVVEMSATQKQALADWQAANALAAARAGAQAGYDSDVLMRAIALVALEETNRLRAAVCQLHPAACAQLPEVTVTQLRDAVRAKILELEPN